MEQADKEDKLIQRLEKLITSGNTKSASFVAQELESIYKKSLQDLDKVAADTTVRERKAILVQRLGDVHKIIRSYSDALRYYKEAISMYPESRTAVSAYLHIADLHKDLGQWEESMAANRAGRDASRRIGHKDGEADCVRGIAYIFWRQGTLDRALQTYEESLAILKDEPESMLKAKIYMETANVHLELREFAKARLLYEKANPVIERSGDRLQQIRYCNNMGFLLFKTRDFEGAKRLYDRQIKIAKMMDDKRWEGWAYSKMSECLTKLGEPKAGLQYAEMSKQALEGINDNVGLPHTYLVFGIAYGAMGDKARAIENFEKAVRLAEASDMGSIAANSTLEYACTLARLDKGLALVQARRALEMFTKMKATKCIDECKALIREMGG